VGGRVGGEKKVLGGVVGVGGGGGVGGKKKMGRSTRVRIRGGKKPHLKIKKLVA